MSDDLRQFTPQPPAYALDWYGLDETYSWIQRMRDCPQSPVYHAEGDVWIHTRMVVEALIAAPAWRALGAADRELLFAAAVLHDAGKPATTRVEGGSITSRGHSGKGARMARRILWDMGFPPALREAIAALIRFHQLPYYLIGRPNAQRLALEISQSARTDHLAILAEADVRGRICQDLPRLLDNIARYAAFCRDQRCWAVPRAFPSDHARFLYFRTPAGRDPDEAAPETTRAAMTMMAGLPGAGKDAWLAANYAGPVISTRESAEEKLQAGESFAWNAANLAREQRAQMIDLAAAAHAQVRIVWVEAPRQALWERNRGRERLIDSMMEHWETPDLAEAHAVVKIW